MQSFDVFFDLCLSKRLSKQSWGWWIKTPPRPLWRHRNDMRELWHIREGILLNSLRSDMLFTLMWEGRWIIKPNRKYCAILWCQSKRIRWHYRQDGLLGHHNFRPPKTRKTEFYFSTKAQKINIQIPYISWTLDKVDSAQWLKRLD